MKYIIKNCSTINNNWCRDKQKHCKDITDCPLKQIVELCDSNVSKVLYEGETSKIKFVEGNPLAKKILELLEIEEVDE